MLSPWLGSAVTVGTLLGMLGLLTAARSRYGLEPEYTRKLGQVGFGAAALAFPLVFRAVWPVIVLSGIAVALTAAIRWVPGFAGATPAWVERRSAGDFCLVLAVAALYALTGGDRIQYGIPVLTLTFAVTAAALVGTRHGRTGIPLDSGKSLEGSIAFFVVAVACAQVPLMLMAPLGALDAARIAFVYASVVTVVEAAAGGGIDNLLVPMAGYFAVSALLQHDPMALRGVMLAAALFVGAVAIRRFFAMGWATEMARE
jgi:dolichol kinase